MASEDKKGYDKKGQFACPSFYSKLVSNQNSMRANLYSGSRQDHSVPSDMKGEKRNVQKGP